ncbi:MAG TPA: hypothetical protein VGF33_09995 [Caulobacteraceae bacterium]
MPVTDPRQRRYEAKRRAWRRAHPLADVPPGPPALRLTPFPGPCARCAGSGKVPATAIDLVGVWITCPACGGEGSSDAVVATVG